MPRSAKYLALAALSGFIALSWEIIWARLFNFVTGSRAPAFGAMLGSYLLGLALGSLWSMRWQKWNAVESERSLFRLFAWANVAAFFVVPLASWLVVWLPEHFYLPGGFDFQSWFWTLPLVMAASALQGTILPLLCHVAIPADEKAGARLSYVYLANIVGSGAGSLLTGFVLMDALTLANLSSTLLVASLVISGIMTSRSQPGWKSSGKKFGVVFLMSFVIFTASRRFLNDGLWERLQYKHEYNGMRFTKVVESKHGVVTIDTNNTVYGNGAYDGHIGTTLTPGDWHVRPYFLSAVHPNPKRVLVIGMSAGAWTQILASHPQVEKVDVVEISHAYLEVIAAYPEVNSILTNPKVTIHIDDGRRWLKRHKDDKYDAIMMNTTHHWREFASALLSQEFLTVARDHLAPGGVVMWNCTDSPRAAKTGMTVFPHTVMCLNNCTASMQPIEVDKERWRRVLSEYKVDGKRVFDLTSEKGRADLDGVVRICDNDRDPMPDGAPDRWWITTRPRMEKLWGGAEVITDDNLGHEYQ